MKKYWTIFKLALQEEMQYRFNFFVRMLNNGVVLLFFFYFWVKIYSEGNKIGIYDLKTLITYYLVAMIFSSILFQSTSWVVSDEISEGKINKFLLQPINYFLNHFAQYLGGFLNSIIYYAPIIFVIVALLRKYFVFPGSLAQWIFFLVSFIFAALLYFLIYFNLALMSFWLERIWGLNYGFMIFSNFMEGRLIPIDLFPGWFIKLSNFLPFKYMLYVPASIFLNKIDFSLSQLLIPLSWIIILIFLSQISWRKGIKIYEAYGM